MNTEIKLLEVSEYAMNQYKRFVHGAWNESSDVVRKKLHRDFVLGVSLPATAPDIECRAYGQLYIYRKGYEIIKIGANQGRCKAYVNINLREKDDLNRLLGIGEMN